MTCALYSLSSWAQRLCLLYCPQLNQLMAGSEHCEYLSLSLLVPLSLACTFFFDGKGAPSFPSKLHCHSSWPGPAERVTGRAHRSWPADSWDIFKRIVVLIYKRTVRQAPGTRADSDLVQGLFWDLPGWPAGCLFYVLPSGHWT